MRMNLFKQNPKEIHQLVLAFSAVAVFYIYMERTMPVYIYVGEKESIVSNRVVPIPSAEENVKAGVTGFNVLHIEASGPSLAQSNFDVDPAGSVTVYFNERVDFGNVVRKFSLSKASNEETVSLSAKQELRSGYEGDFTWEWQKDWIEKVIFTPEVPLEAGEKYIAKLEPGYFNKSRLVASNQGMQLNILVSSLPGFLNSSFKDGSTGVVLDDRMIIRFKSPMDKESLLEGMQFGPISEKLNISVHSKSVTIDNVLEPATGYTLFVPASTLDLYGRSLGEDISITFSTAD